MSAGRRYANVDCLGNGFSHPRLSRTRLKAGQQRLERTIVTKEFGKICHRAKITRFDSNSQNRNCPNRPGTAHHTTCARDAHDS
jgi:hypothetical protein